MVYPSLTFPLGDLNHSRTAATNAIRKEAGFEIIVAKSDRVTTEVVVDQQLKQAIRAHGARNTIPVLTKIDEFFLDNHSVENIIHRHTTEPFPIIRSYLAEAEKTVNDVEEQIREAGEGEGEEDEAKLDDLYEMLEALQNYQEYLVKSAKLHFVKHRAATLENEMRWGYKELDHDPIHIFSVSAAMYLDRMKKR
ncbi:hypothetical protein BU23DRAFT_309170 [Bimuria novae-zelandiae CBS 107.79]|uniref:Uncharacterized protein n=1 Tax=Bimuria novae-zelandiae CBS 107.79 TaxID=1447943 RepID=A0A6A5V120_9PLEO|nr:hypothetical protein BU23DRAFT_309170 [Bimuria novae-zelandiae CBS 107.79]